MAYIGIYKGPGDVFIRSTIQSNDEKLRNKGCVPIIELQGRNITHFGQTTTITAREYLSKNNQLPEDTSFDFKI
jgi:hypothetical protein